MIAFQSHISVTHLVTENFYSGNLQRYASFISKDRKFFRHAVDIVVFYLRKLALSLKKVDTDKIRTREYVVTKLWKNIAQKH
jgi:hypothetical protein